MNNQNNLMFWVLGVLAAGLIVSAALSVFIVHAVQVRRIDPQHGTAGEPLIVRYAMTNRSRLLSAFSIHLEERIESPAKIIASSWVMHIGPRETVHGETIHWPKQRGRITFDRMRIWTTFPFGIIRKSKVISQVQHTLVYPMMYQMRPGLLAAIAPKGLMGSKISHHAGAGDDYYGTREYKPGDSMRHISWKRTARMDQLITIERTSPSPAKLRVILDLTAATDTLRVDPNGPLSARDLEERAISLAASILRTADLEGYEIGLTVQGFNQPPIAVRRNQWHFHKIMTALASLELGSPRIERVSQPIRDAERAALVIISPDRVHPMHGREDAMYLTARQLDELAAVDIKATSDSAMTRQPIKAPPKKVAA